MTIKLKLSFCVTFDLKLTSNLRHSLSFHVFPCWAHQPTGLCGKFMNQMLWVPMLGAFFLGVAACDSRIKKHQSVCDVKMSWPTSASEAHLTLFLFVFRSKLASAGMFGTVFNGESFHSLLKISYRCTLWALCSLSAVKKKKRKMGMYNLVPKKKTKAVKPHEKVESRLYCFHPPWPLYSRVTQLMWTFDQFSTYGMSVFHDLCAINVVHECFLWSSFVSGLRSPVLRCFKCVGRLRRTQFMQILSSLYAIYT